MHSQRGFSLVELMITVAIIGILASIAMPLYGEAQLQAKQTEIPANLDGILTAETAFEAANDYYINVSLFMPDQMPDKQARPWIAGDFADLGWAPDGDVRASYAVSTDGFPPVAIAISDLDGDGRWAYWEADHTHPAEKMTSAGAY